MPPPRTFEQLVERFWNTVLKTDECWVWLGDSTSNGYGRYFFKGTKRYMAHRFSYELECGPISEGLQVCHKCDNRICVRPSHLFLGTAKDNAIDRQMKGRQIRKLTASQVVTIRERLLAGEHGKALAEEFGITTASLSRINTNTNWQWLPPLVAA